MRLFAVHCCFGWLFGLGRRKQVSSLFDKPPKTNREHMKLKIVCYHPVYLVLQYCRFTFTIAATTWWVDTGIKSDDGVRRAYGVSRDRGNGNCFFLHTWYLFSSIRLEVCRTLFFQIMLCLFLSRGKTCLTLLNNWSMPYPPLGLCTRIKPAIDCSK